MSTAAAAEPATRPARGWLAFWRAPAGRPAWARPVVALIAAASAFSYAWRATRPVNIEIYYAAAVRSMSMKFSNFILGAFDPAGTVSTDKLPGAFWLQALSVRVFGVHNWALVLPQVVEGTLTVLVLYHHQDHGPCSSAPGQRLLLPTSDLPASEARQVTVLALRKSAQSRH